MIGKRMFSEAVTERDDFCSLSFPAQVLYFKLGISADDDGFVMSPSRTARSIGADSSAVDELTAAGFLFRFPSGVYLLPHFLINNKIRRDRYHPSVFMTEREALYVDRNMLLCVFDETPDKAYFTSLNDFYSSSVTEGKETKGKETKRKSTKGKASPDRSSDGGEPSSPSLMSSASGETPDGGEKENPTGGEKDIPTGGEKSSEHKPSTGGEKSSEHKPPTGGEKIPEHKPSDDGSKSKPQSGTVKPSCGASVPSPPSDQPASLHGERDDNKKNLIPSPPSDQPASPHGEGDNNKRTFVPFSSKACKSTRSFYGIYGNVLLSDGEYAALCSEFPDSAASRIDRLSEYLMTSGKTYASHKAVIEAWARADRASEERATSSGATSSGARFDGATPQRATPSRKSSRTSPPRSPSLSALSSFETAAFFDDALRASYRSIPQ